MGAYDDSAGFERGMVVDENSGIWAPAIETSLPVDAAANPKAVIGSVACWSIGDCVATGGYDDAAGVQRGLIIVENSGVWGSASEVAPPSNANPNANGRRIDLLPVGWQLQSHRALQRYQ